MSIVIKEDKKLKVYTAIYERMTLGGQGKTPLDAMLSLMDAIDGYVGYILEEHPDECVKYFNRGTEAP